MKSVWSKVIKKDTRKAIGGKILAIMVGSMILLTGCGDSEKVIEGNVQNDAPGSVQTGSAEDARKDTQDGAGTLEDAGTGTEHTGYLFTYKGVAVEVDKDVAPVIEVLGEPVSYFEAASCAFEGLDKIYTYNSFEIDTYPQGNDDYVSMIILKDDSVTTAEGVSIGDSLEKLQQTYGTDSVEENGMLVYEKDGMKLCFILQNEVIVSVEYRSTVLEET